MDRGIFLRRIAICAGTITIVLAGYAPARAADPAAPPATLAAVARTVHGIIGYTRWPRPLETVRICTAGHPRYDGNLDDKPGGAPGPHVELIRLDASPRPAIRDCNVLYLGQLPADAYAALLPRIAGAPILTIVESDPACRAGAMFCLHARGSRAGFEMNLDAVARSGLRIHPKVLMLARSAGAPL